MKIQKRRPECKTIEDVVLQNVGMTKEEFLSPKASYAIKGLTEASALLGIAAHKGEHITIVGDYDADGICASSILNLAFTEKGWDFSVRLPRRFSEGYGISDDIIDEIDSGLIITVDNGIAAATEIARAKEKGLTVIVTDHHLPDADCNIPNADVVIDPNALAETADFNGYCGAGIAYKLAIELLGADHPLIPKLKSLAAIATIADVMPLVEENRFIVKEGLNTMLMPSGRTAGLGAILATCKQEKYFSAKNVAFKLAPMINAPGRMQDDGAEVSYNILTFEGEFRDAMEKANYLADVNTQRKQEKDKGLKLLHTNIETNGLSENKPLIVFEPNLHEGLVGIYAGQLAEEYQTPCFVLTNSEEEGMLKGSGRTFGEINIKDLLDKHQNLLAKYGGHSEAAGISLMECNLSDLRVVLSKELEDYPVVVDDTIYYDLKIDAKQIDVAVKNLETFEPFGQGNPEIVFYIKDFVVADTQYLQEGKSVKFKSSNGDAVCFGLGEEYDNMGKPRVVDLVGTISKNCFMSSVKNQVEVIKIIKPETAVPVSPLQAQLAALAGTL